MATFVFNVSRLEAYLYISYQRVIIAMMVVTTWHCVAQFKMPNIPGTRQSRCWSFLRT